MTVNAILGSDSLDGFLEHLDELPGWESGVSGNSEQVVDLLDGVDLAFSDQIVADSESWGSSGDEESVEEEGDQSAGVGALALNHDRGVHLLQLFFRDGSNQSDDGPVLFHDFAHVQWSISWAGGAEHGDDISEHFLGTFGTVVNRQLGEFKRGEDLVELFG